jgi:cell wall-associated NlpC family hydrolase
MSLKRIVVLWIVLMACGTVKRGTIPWEERKKAPPKVVEQKPTTKPALASTANASSASKALSKDEKKMKELLDRAYIDWKGVPYVLGGSGYSGVDCSSFMQIVLHDYFEIKIPRVTADQIKVGKSVKKKNIKIGDLVFFRTGKKTLHVGIMINNEQFLHASTSSGVMISALQQRYWSDAYLTTRRVF